MYGLPVHQFSTAITTDQMREVDRLKIEEFAISLPQMMENAGRHLADLAWRMVKAEAGQPAEPKIIIVCGMGNNGGGGLVAARYLLNWGAAVGVCLAGDPKRLSPILAERWKTFSMLDATIINLNDSNLSDLLAGSELIIDAIIGYGGRGNPRGSAGELIKAINSSGRPLLSLDAPSGLDTTSGFPGDPTVAASVILTLALPKTGLIQSESQAFTGNLFIADIGVPKLIYQQLNIHNPINFDNHAIIEIQQQ